MNVEIYYRHLTKSLIKILKNRNLLGQIFSKGNGFIFGLFLQIMNCNFKWQFVFLVSHFFDCFCSNHKYQLLGNNINNCFIQRFDVVIVGEFASIFTSNWQGVRIVLISIKVNLLRGTIDICLSLTWSVVQVQ